MNFVDKVQVNVRAGKGGNGHLSFRRERYVDKGGPDGGDGGKGGDVVFEASRNQNTLSAFRYDREITASDGQSGGKAKKHGKSAKALIVKVPVGTQVIDQDGYLQADLIGDGQSQVIADGGKGGFGNAHFVSSIRQAPNFAEKGEAGQSLTLTLELKLIADVGLVGLPNAGKSTLLAHLSNAKPQIADYPFTTLIPNLGVVDIDKTSSVLLADIPGLIAGAASGKGLGHEFLRHVERTRLIVHLIDVYQEDLADSYQIIRSELKAYSKQLDKLPELVVINKVEGLDKNSLEAKLKPLKQVLPKSKKLLTISAKAGLNLDEFKYQLKKMLAKLPKISEASETKQIPIITLKDQSRAWQVEKLKKGYLVSGERIEQFAARSDLNNPEAVSRLKDIMKRMGILHELKRRGLEAGDQIYIGKTKETNFNY